MPDTPMREEGYPQPKVQILFNFNFGGTFARDFNALYLIYPTKRAAFSYKAGGSIPTKRATFSYQTGGS
jgi:hypothetical protein